MSTRSPARQRLAAAIERHAEAQRQHDRVSAAAGKLLDDLYERVEPAVRARMDALNDARRAAPAQLVAMAMGEDAPVVPSIAEAERALDDAQRQLVDTRSARRLLSDESERAAVSVTLAREELDAAHAAVLSSDPRLQALREEALRGINRGLRCLGILQCLPGQSIGMVSGHGLVAMVKGAVVPDREWQAALAALRTDPDAVLPGLPVDNDAGAGDQRAA